MTGWGGVEVVLGVGLEKIGLLLEIRSMLQSFLFLLFFAKHFQISWGNPSYHQSSLELALRTSTSRTIGLGIKSIFCVARDKLLSEGRPQNPQKRLRALWRVYASTTWALKLHLDMFCLKWNSKYLLWVVQLGDTCKGIESKGTNHFMLSTLHPPACLRLKLVSDIRAPRQHEVRLDFALEHSLIVSKQFAASSSEGGQLCRKSPMTVLELS